MKHSKIFELLPDYHEGSLTAEELRSVEEHLSSCPGCRQASESIAFGLSELRREDALEIPPHYFNNFLPRLHERIDEHRKRRLHFFLPSWMEPLVAPLSVFSVAISVAGLFFLLRTLPAGADGSLQGLVAQVSQDELVRLADQEINMSEPLLHQPIVETASNADLVSRHLGHQLIAGEGTAEDATVFSGAGIDVPEIELLSDDEVTSVIDHLNQTRTL